MTTTTTARWTSSRDKYGRATHTYNVNGRTAGVVVRLPRVYRDKCPGRNYLVNNWTLTDRDPARVTYHATLAAAKATLAGVA